jgi:hypothetical protein
MLDPNNLELNLKTNYLVDETLSIDTVELTENQYELLKVVKKYLIDVKII